MSTTRVVTYPGHGTGPTVLAFSNDGMNVLTGGQDCTVRRWKTVHGQEQEPDMAHEADDAITSVAVSDDHWFSASEDSELRRYPRDAMEMDSVMTSAVGVPIRCVAVDSKGQKLAVTSDELAVKLIDLSDTTNVSLLEGHTRGVRKATWHPNEPLLTTCGSDGDIIVWDTTNHQQPAVVKKIDGLIPVEIDSKSAGFAHDCSALWHNSGEYFFIATRAREIVTISKDKWTKHSTFSDPSVSGEITALALSPNGVYLASSSNNKINVWSIQSRRCLFTHTLQSPSVVNQLAFSPSQNLLGWTDSTGSLNLWTKPVSEEHPDPVKRPGASKTSLPSAIQDPTDSLFTDNIGDLNDVDLDIGDIGDVDDDWIIDDIGGGMRDAPEQSSSSKYVKEMVNITKAQPAFQPGSTPMHNKKRYLAYNMLGVIEVTDQDTHQIVNVEFFDRSSRIGYHFTDHFNYDMGYLGDCGSLFACQPDTDHPAQVYYKPHSRWNAQSDWTYSLSRPTIRVLGVAAGGIPPSASGKGTTSDDDLNGLGNVVVATNEGDLTFLSGTGRERRIMGLGADFVAMAASHDCVFVVHRAGSTTIDGSQNLSYSLINFDDFSVRQHGILPICKGHILKWVGITDEGAPAIYDSNGYIHILTKHRVPHHASWARVVDTNLLERRQGKDESYWLVGLSAGTFMCLILKGKQEYPGFPRPLIQELPLQLPFRKQEAAEEKIERELLFLEIDRDALGEELTTSDITRREMAIDKEFIQLIQQACKANNAPRILELSKLLHHDKSLEAAIKLADFYHLVGLKDKLETMKSSREDIEDRMIAARDKRLSWNRMDQPQRRIQEPPSALDRFNKPFQNFGPPPQIHRPGLSPAILQVQPSRYASVAPTDMDYDPPSPSASPATNGKRKRDDTMDLDLDLNSSPMKRNSSQAESIMPSLPPFKTKANPFARKPNQENNRNPFGRKADSLSLREVKKTESFFEKVDSAESKDREKPTKRTEKKGKEKEKKEGPKQTTLFGMKPGVTNDKPARNAKSTMGAKQSTKAAEEISNDSPVDTMTESAQDSQSGDTQPVVTREESPDWEVPVDKGETQVTDETQLIECKF